MAYHRLSILEDGEPQVQEFLAFLVNFFLSGYNWMMPNIEEVSSYGNKEKSMNRTMVSLTLAPTLEDELNAVIDTGLYSDVESFVSDAPESLNEIETMARRTLHAASHPVT